MEASSDLMKELRSQRNLCQEIQLPQTNVCFRKIFAQNWLLERLHGLQIVTYYINVYTIFRTSASAAGAFKIKGQLSLHRDSL